MAEGRGGVCFTVVLVGRNLNSKKRGYVIVCVRRTYANVQCSNIAICAYGSPCGVEGRGTQAGVYS